MRRGRKKKQPPKRFWNKQQQFAARVQRVRLYLDAAEKEWEDVLKTARKMGWEIEESGKTKPPDNLDKVAWSFMNFMGISKYYAKGQRNITRDNVPKKYSYAVWGIHRAIRAEMERERHRIMSRNSNVKIKKKHYELMPIELQDVIDKINEQKRNS